MTETTKRTTKVWAHRGASGYRPENTLEALNLPSDRAQMERTGCTYFRRRRTHRYARRKRRPCHRRNRTDQRYDTGSIERIKSQYTRRTIGNLSHSNSGRSTGAHAHHRYDGKHRTKEQHLLLSGNGRENPETGKRNEHGRPADLFLL